MKTIITLVLCCLLAGCEHNSPHTKIVKHSADGSTVEKWVLFDSIDDGPTIKYYPSGTAQMMYIAKNDTVKGKVAFYYNDNRLEGLVQMIQTHLDGFAYYFHPNGKFKEVSYYRNDKLIYLKTFDDEGRTLKHEGYFPVEFSKLEGDCEFLPLTWNGKIPRSGEQKVRIKWRGCAPDALKVSINEGHIEPSAESGVYRFRTSAHDTIVFRVQIYDPRLNRYLANEFGFLTRGR